jgi:putative ABC transport system permease protein
MLGTVVAILSFVMLRTIVDAWYAGADATSANRLITRNKVSLTFTLPISYLNKLRRVPGVSGVSYANWFGGVYINEKNFFPQFAIDPDSYFGLFPEYVIPPEQLREFLHDRKGVIAGRKLVEEYRWKIGDQIPIRGTIYPGTWNFVLRGIYTGKTNKIDETQFFFRWDYLNEQVKQTSATAANQAGIFLLGLKNAQDAAAVAKTVDEEFRNSIAETLTETEKAFQLGFVAMTEAILMVIKAVSFVVILIIMAVMANTMAMTARERRREYATLKTLGFGPGFLWGLIAGESLAISISGGLIGLYLSYPLAERFAARFGTLFPVFNISTSTAELAIVASVLVGALAAIAPAWRASRTGIVEGLRAMG